MNIKIKIKRCLHRFIYGKGYKPAPATVEELCWRYSRGIKNWKIKYCSNSFKYKLWGSPWCLVHTMYPDGVERVQGEIGANVLSKTRYVLKNYESKKS